MAKKKITSRMKVGIILTIGGIVISILSAILNMTVNLTNVSPQVYSINEFFRNWINVIYTVPMAIGIFIICLEEDNKKQNRN